MCMQSCNTAYWKCFEVKCRNADISDGYGQSLHRRNACYDESKTVVITIADACPCRYPNNQYSNQRWCCGDVAHLDISQEAFSQLANLGIGVIGLSYREVDCSTQGNAGNGGGGGSSSDGSDGGNYRTATGSSEQGSGQQGSGQQGSGHKQSWSWGNWR
ncbi:hypothetical protein GPECTOR_1g781 [Gonium pectorale]|uniref:Expansin-like EG45 domain-containing protein n=1 Tax=Gonium pectorale TaxID=33097 RepID=A0A150H416_GONPE|nr:hypothetical protein GPECTOR_1g781 [Gonium pectorale]|eukprot:KXZ56866.1 hypothetical protein GPECTOR_1g781 [Gonium pectorale]